MKEHTLRPGPAAKFEAAGGTGKPKRHLSALPSE